MSSVSRLGFLESLGYLFSYKSSQKVCHSFWATFERKNCSSLIFGLFCTLFGYCLSSIWSSVTRLGDLLDFGQLYKAFGNNKFAQISHILRNFCKGVKMYHFWATFIDIWRFLSGHTGPRSTPPRSLTFFAFLALPYN